MGEHEALKRFVIPLLYTRVISCLHWPDNVDLCITDGDWKVWVSTARSAAPGTEVILIAYGDQGQSDPISLGTAGDGLFQEGNQDQFKVSWMA